MKQFFVKRPKFLSATSSLRVQQNLVHLDRFIHFSKKVVGVTLNCCVNRVNKRTFSASVSAGFEHGLAGSVKRKTVIEMDKSQMFIYSSKLKGLLNKQLDKDNINGIYRV